MNTHLLFILLGNADMFNEPHSNPAALNLFKVTGSAENPMEEKCQHTKPILGAHETTEASSLSPEPLLQLLGQLRKVI